MEWDAPAIILAARPYGEGDAVAAVMTEAHGLHRGLARGGASRGKAATWQPGNMVQVQWTARLSDQLGSFSGELIHAGAAQAMQQAMPLAMLSAACAIAEGALPEREPMPRIFAGLLRLIPQLPLGDAGAERADRLGNGGVVRAWLWPRSVRLRGDRTHPGAGLCFAEDRAGGKRTRRRGSGRRGCCRCQGS